MRIKYFQTAWNDLTKSEGWLRKMMLLALITMIPIFGAIVVMGYLYGWARDIAWGVRNPLPARIFANEDGKLYRRGFFIFVIGIVAGVLPYIVFTFAEGSMGVGWAGLLASSVNFGYSPHGSFSSFGGPAVSAGSLTTGMLLYLLGMVLTLGICFFRWAASMRVSIYDNLSSGFQVGKLWSMLRADGSGILRIFGMVILANIVAGFVLFLIFMLLMLVFVAMFAGTFISMVDGGSAAGNVGAVISALLVGGLFFTIWAYAAVVCSMIVEALTARALGYWVGQFDVPHWGGQNDPAPFENPAREVRPQQPQPVDSVQQVWGAPQATVPVASDAPVAGQPQNEEASAPAAVEGEAAVAAVPEADPGADVSAATDAGADADSATDTPKSSQ